MLKHFTEAQTARKCFPSFGICALYKVRKLVLQIYSWVASQFCLRKFSEIKQNVSIYTPGWKNDWNTSLKYSFFKELQIVL